MLATTITNIAMVARDTADSIISATDIFHIVLSPSCTARRGRIN